MLIDRIIKILNFGPFDEQVPLNPVKCHRTSQIKKFTHATPTLWR